MWQFLSGISERDFWVGVLFCIVLLQSFWILLLYRKNAFLLVLLMRANERVIDAANVTSRIHLHAYVAGARPLLSDLAHERVEDWELIYDDVEKDT